MKVFKAQRWGIWLVLFLLILAILIWSGVVLAGERVKDLSLKLYDVGQGDSIFIHTPGGYKILIDGGPSSRVVDLLNEDLGVTDRTLDLVILTHPDADHLKGLVEVVKKFPVKKVITTTKAGSTSLYQMWSDTLSKENIPHDYVEAGESITLSDQVTLDFVWPSREGLTSTETNDTSIIFKLSYGSFDALLTGDADSRVDPYIGSVGDVEVLKVPHHGSKTGMTQEFLQDLTPEVAVISVGAKNTYGHPSTFALDQLARVGSKVFRTDQHGSVEIVSNGQTWYTRTSK